MATKFFQHYIYIGGAMKQMGGRDYQLWDEEDGFFYDVLRYPDGTFHKFRVRSLVGLIPLFAVDGSRSDGSRTFHEFMQRRRLVHAEPARPGRPGLLHRPARDGERRDVLSIVDRHQLAPLLQRMWDEQEFLSAGGMRSLSKYHESHPFGFGGSDGRYEPAEADVKIKGGNSNWRGPIWFPTSFLMIESLRKFGKAFGPDYAVRDAGVGGTRDDARPRWRAKSPTG